MLSGLETHSSSARLDSGVEPSAYREIGTGVHGLLLARNADPSDMLLTRETCREFEPRPCQRPASLPALGEDR